MVHGFNSGVDCYGGASFIVWAKSKSSEGKAFDVTMAGGSCSSVLDKGKGNSLAWGVKIGLLLLSLLSFFLLPYCFFPVSCPVVPLGTRLYCNAISFLSPPTVLYYELTTLEHGFFSIRSNKATHTARPTSSKMSMV